MMMMMMRVSLGCVEYGICVQTDCVVVFVCVCVLMLMLMLEFGVGVRYAKLAQARAIERRAISQ